VARALVTDLAEEGRGEVKTASRAARALVGNRGSGGLVGVWVVDLDLLATPGVAVRLCAHGIGRQCNDHVSVAVTPPTGTQSSGVVGDALAGVCVPAVVCCSGGCRCRYCRRCRRRRRRRRRRRATSGGAANADLLANLQVGAGHARVGLLQGCDGHALGVRDGPAGVAARNGNIAGAAAGGEPASGSGGGEGQERKNSDGPHFYYGYKYKTCTESGLKEKITRVSGMND